MSNSSPSGSTLIQGFFSLGCKEEAGWVEGELIATRF
jgi:hypothetical protein